MRIVVDLLPEEPKKCIFSKNNGKDIDCILDNKLCELCFHHSNRCSKLVLLDNIN